MEMKKRGKDKNTILERVSAPIFGVAVEVLDKQKFRIYRSVAKTIDAMLAGARGVRCIRGVSSKIRDPRDIKNTGTTRSSPKWSNRSDSKILLIQPVAPLSNKIHHLSLGALMQSLGILFFKHLKLMKRYHSKEKKKNFFFAAEQCTMTMIKSVLRSEE